MDNDVVLPQGPLDGSSWTHPLVVKEFGLLLEQPPSVEVDEGIEEAKA